MKLLTAAFFSEHDSFDSMVVLYFATATFTPLTYFSECLPTFYLFTEHLLVLPCSMD